MIDDKIRKFIFAPLICPAPSHLWGGGGFNLANHSKFEIYTILRTPWAHTLVEVKIGKFSFAPHLYPERGEGGDQIL